MGLAWQPDSEMGEGGKYWESGEAKAFESEQSSKPDGEGSKGTGWCTIRILLCGVWSS